MKENYFNLLSTGHSIDFKRLSISPYQRFGKTYVQVHSDDYRSNFSRFYKDIEEAIDEFLGLKKKLYGARL